MLLAALALPANAQLSLGYFYTDITGAQPTVSSTAAQKIEFTTSFPFTIAGARITMKADAGITENITATFYVGGVTLSGGGVTGSPTSLGSVTLTPAQFIGQGTVSQYSIRAFDLPIASRIAALPNQLYTVVLTSAANGNNYFVKLNSPCASDANGVCLTAPPADMSVSLATSPATLVAGAQASITGTYTNVGYSATSGTVTGTISIPSGWTGLSYSATGWTCGTPTAGSTFSCTRNNSLAINSSYPTITVTGTIPAGAAGTFSTTGTVTSTGDPVLANNTATLSNVPYLGSPDLAVSVSTSPSPLSASTAASITVSSQNVGGSATNGTVTVTVGVPAGWTNLTFTATGWNCGGGPVAGATMTCTRTDALDPNASYPNVVVNGTVAADSPTPISITGTIAGGSDYNAANNSQTATPTVQQPNLTVSVATSPTPLLAATPGTITVSSQNIGSAPTGGLVTATVTIPSGWTGLSVSSATGWTCGTPTAGATLSCTRSDSLAPSTSYPNIVVSGTVNPSSPASVSITGTITGGGDTTPANNTDTKSATVYLPDLTVTVSSAPSPLVAGGAGSITVATQNIGSAPSAGTVTLQIPVPAGWTNLSVSGDGWTCGTPTAGSTLTCTRNDALAASGSYPNVVVSGTVAANSPSPLSLSASVSGGGDTTLGNNSGSQNATVNYPDLQSALTAAPNPLVAGTAGSLLLTVSNVGLAAHNGLVTATIAVPANWTALSWSGTGWTCPNAPVAGQNFVCTRSDVLAASGSYPALTVNGSVPTNAQSPLHINASVAGASDTNAANDSTSGNFTIVPARGAAFSCVGNAGVPPIVRAEGLSELVGDLVLNCTGGTPTAQNADVPRANIQIFLNTNITGRLNSSDSSYSEALLMIDEPAHGSQKLCSANGGCALTGTGAVNGVNYADGSNPNVFLGRQVGANSIAWLGVPIDPPGAGATRVIRITNVRANANQLGVSSTLIPTQIVMFVSVTGSTAMPINNPQQTVAFIQPGLTFSTRSAASSYLQCVSFNKSAATDNTATLSDGLGTIVRFSEGFASSFKRRNTAAYAFDGASPQPVQQNVPGAIYNTESGFYAPNMTILNAGSTASTAAANAGLADSGTRLMARFANVPAGIALYATVYPVGSSTSIDANCLGPSAGGACIKSVNNSSSTSLTQARLISTDSNGAGGFSGVTATASTKEGAGVAPLTLNNGSGMAVWEVLNADPLTSQTYEFGVGVAFASNTSSNLPGLGSATVAGGFAPLSSVTTASSSAPIPRFADTSSARTIFSVNPCTTNLLFVYLTNQAGFDSGIAISNTSSDPHGTAPQAGPCKLNYYGETAGGGAAPAAQTSAVIPAGKQLVAVLSTGGNFGIAATPGFQGYMIAQCQFQYAHGLAYVSDIGANRVAESYQAFVLDSALGSRTGFSSEVLGH